MKLLNAIDLDNTLITVDSFRYIVLRRMNFVICLYIVLRALRLIGRKTFAEKVSKQLKNFLSDNEKRKKAVDFLLTKIDKDILDQIKNNCDENTVTVILSASPEEYVKEFANSFGFNGLGSGWRESKFFHCYGENKIRLLEEEFPSSQYEYNFAISDSNDDISLLNLFKTAILVKNGKYVPLKKTN